MRKEIIKWLDTGLVIPITDNKWVSLVQYVPIIAGITVVPNENNELVPIRSVNGGRVCMDYRNLNKLTQKDHFAIHGLDVGPISKQGLVLFS